ncbi:EF-hand domain-containing protein [Streptomyces sp. NPDC002172]
MAAPIALSSPATHPHLPEEVVSDIESKRRDFDEIDTDDDGFVSAAELAASLQTNPRVSDENVAAVIRIADDDGDRQIDFDEYAKLVR